MAERMTDRERLAMAELVSHVVPGVLLKQKEQAVDTRVVIAALLTSVHMIAGRENELRFMLDMMAGYVDDDDTTVTDDPWPWGPTKN